MQFFKPRLYQLILCLLCVLAGYNTLAQPNTSIDLEKYKSKKYEERTLPSEKTPEGKIPIVKRIFQNTFTHYNYFFNANNLFSNIISKAKLVYKDDYTQLLPFYNYSLNATSQNKSDIDSIIYKVNAGILLHDLRNDWVDDLYLLLGKTYLIRKDFDSAFMVFQYINYIYAPKDEGYDLPIGSNASNNNGIFSIATNEKTSLLNKIVAKPITRNESLLWQVRNLIEMNKLPEASSILSILRVDPKFPIRLKSKLNEQLAYLFYNQQNYDSAAHYLQLALPEAADRNEEARWQYLAGQLYHLANNNNNANKAFNKAEQKATDPYLEVYARLNTVTVLNNDKKETAIESKLKELQQMAKKEKYETYRDVIYYVAALFNLKQNDKHSAINNLLKSAQNTSTNNLSQKQKTYLLLADVAYDSTLYADAYKYYDSAKTTGNLPDEYKEKLTNKQPALKIISANIQSIHLQDSLQTLAKMSEAERIAAVKKIYRQIRKAQGIKDDGSDFGNTTATIDDGSLFFNANNKTGDFYFNNAALKTQGMRDFKTKWGNRPNVDNWQRQAAIQQTNTNINTFNVSDVDDVAKNSTQQDTGKAVTFEGLMLNIPLNQQRINASNEIISKALFENGNLLKDKLNAYPSAINCYEQLINRFPLNKYSEEAMFNLYYCYIQLKQQTKADSIKKAINQIYPEGRYTILLNVGNTTNQKATASYENIYNLFIEGKYNEALTQKRIADNTFGTIYWTPQLLFIESIYYIKQNKDSLAINSLQSLISKYATNALAAKAKTIIDVLRRRKEIENYLTNLNIKKNIDTVTYTAPATTVTKPKVDTIATTPVNTKPTIKKNDYSYNENEKQYAVIVLNKVSNMYSVEVKNAFFRFNEIQFKNAEPPIDLININDDTGLILVGPFNNANEAMNYIDVIKPIAATRIISWLIPQKYSYLIISDSNLQTVKSKKDITPYASFIKEIVPNKF
ncbi:MAG: hypothetical protein JSR09_10935 [Bacteroidetes bacterium]|nr:hypothetical protein [Bacteroidota bacterium]MBS1650206.1 hypothetical protein [Bacteroidota bacterium]